MSGTLIFIPTYNERGNVERLTEQLVALQYDADILFVDDASPDGTGDILDALATRHARVKVIHRNAKAGIGSAHMAGIRFAYARDYQTLISMDCDGTHPPESISEFLALAGTCDVVCGSRYLRDDSLQEWTVMRVLMTKAGHFLTKSLLGIPYDASSAFRLYDLATVPLQAFELVNATGYGFFFESLFVLQINQMRIREVAIRLPARAEGNSKMDVREAARGLWRLFTLCAGIVLHRNHYLVNGRGQGTPHVIDAS